MSKVMNESILQIRDLSVAAERPDGHKVIDGISLEVREGEMLCVVGESGSGKSVTSLSIMGLLPRGSLVPAGGSIRLEGEELLSAGEKRLEALRATAMAMVFQEPMTALNPVAKVGDQIDEVLKAHTPLRGAERRKRILAMMEEVHLPNVERIYRSYPHQLSGGQRQRIMIAMALILRPRLLIADEPTTALDVTTQKQTLSLIRELRDNRGTAVLFITHDMGVVAEIADRVAVMRQGSLVETGTLDQILRNPAEAYTRKLLSAVPSLVPRAAAGAADAEVLLQISDLGKTYSTRSLLGKVSEVKAAAGVSLTVRRGRTLGIVGESGSGKSTVARCAIRLIEPSEGTILVAGKDISRLRGAALKQHRRRIQVVFQDPYRSLNPRIRVGESVIEGLTNFGVPRVQAMAEAAALLEMVGLPADAVSRYPHQFSGGQRQRIAIARALAMKPDILIADEAVSALDVSVQAQVLELLNDIQRRLGVGTLFITHDLRVAAQICDEIVVMKGGRIVEQGPTSEVLVDPKDPYTRSLIQAAPGRHWDFPNFRPVECAQGSGLLSDLIAPSPMAEVA
jgi:peptide/nickel transport system ATP-binding protein